ncbi:MAG: phosphatase PAP2 family protein [Rhodocyclaceae bacterium]
MKVGLRVAGTRRSPGCHIRHERPTDCHVIARHAKAVAWSLAAIAILLAGALLVCPARGCPLPEFDAAGLTLAYGLASPWSNAFFATITWFGSALVLLPLALLAFRKAGWRRDGAYLPLAVLGAVVLSQGAKLLAGRPRPDLFPTLIAMPADASYPSAHTLQATAFFLAWLLQPGAVRGTPAIVVVALLVLLVAASRIHLQVHFPSDVAFGMAAGACWALAVRSLPFWKENRP